MLGYLRKYYPNCYSVVIALILLIWYNGIAGVLNQILPDRSPIVSAVLIIIPILILLTDDGTLKHLYSADNLNDDELVRIAGAARAMSGARVGAPMARTMAPIKAATRQN